jgi:hypothetical protein
MLKRTNRVGVPALVAGALTLGLMAPGAAAAKPSLATVTHDVKVANARLAQVRKLAHHHPAAAKLALARTRVAAADAAHQARWLHGTADTQTAAQAFTLVAGQYNNDLNAFTGLLGSVAGPLQSALAQALQPALAGQTQALGFLGALMPQLPAPAAGTATTAIGGLLAGGPGELQALTGLLSGGNLPAQVQTTVGQAVTTAGGVLDATLAQLEALVPQLPAEAQPLAQQVLTQLKTVFGQLSTMLGQVSQQLGGLLGSNFSSGLGQITGLLQQLLPGLGGNGLPGVLTGGTGATGIGATGTGTTGTGTTGTGATGTLTGVAGGLPIQLPAFIQGLLGRLGVPFLGGR